MRNKVSFQTWTPAELAIGEYLAAWALERLTKVPINKRRALLIEAFAKRRVDIIREEERRRNAFVDAWLNNRPLPKAERGFRVHALTKILHKIIERSPF